MKKEPKAPKKISATRVVVTSFLVDVSDVLVNLVVSVITGSIVVRAEFLKGAADMIGSGLLIIGVKQSRRKADERHPFGFGKEIYFWTLMSAILMVALASSFSIYFGYQQLINPEPISNKMIALGTLIFASCTNGYAMSLSYKRMMKQNPISALWEVLTETHQVATKNAFIKDAVGTISAVTGLIAVVLYVITGDPLFDGLGAMMVGILLIILATFLIHGLRDYVVGRSASQKTIDAIRKAVLTINEVQDILDLKTMVIGADKILVNIEVHLQDHLDTDEIEVVIDRIKSKVQKDISSVTHIQVELETPEK